MIAGCNRDAGYSLVELLVVIAITAALAGLMTGGLANIQIYWSRVQQAPAADEDELGAQRLRGLLAGTRNVFSIDAPNQPGRLLFIGKPSEITFVTLSEGYALQGGMVRLHVFTESAKDKSNVFVTAAVYRSNSAEVTEKQPALLFENVASLRFRYYGRRRPGDEPIWNDEWIGMLTLPWFVDVEVSITDGKSVRTLRVPVELRHALRSG